MELAITKTNVLKRDLNRRLGVIESGLKKTIGAAWDAGEILTELKNRLGHGEWLPYLKEIKLGERQAQKYMKLFNDYDREAAIEYKAINAALEDKSKKNGSDKNKKEDTNSSSDKVVKYKVDVETHQKISLVEKILDNLAISLTDSDVIKFGKAELNKKDIKEIVSYMRKTFKPE
jgi:Protein of unknown function (DUF3102)